MAFQMFPFQLTHGFSKSILFVLVIMAYLLSPPLVMAQVGVSAVQFLNIEPDARASALGSTGVTRVGSAHAAFWNPALLGFQQEGVLSLSHSNWLPALGNTLYHDHLTFSHQLLNRTSFSGYITYLNLGSQMATDDVGNELGQFSNYEMATGLSVGSQIARNFSIGIGAKYIRSDLAGGQFSDGAEINAGSAFSADIGLYWQSSSMNFNSHIGRLKWGTAITNMGTGIRYMNDDQNSPLPANFRTGFSYDMNLSAKEDHTISISFDLNKSLSRMEENISGNDTAYTAMSALSAIFRSWSPVTVVDGNSTSSLSVMQQFTYGVGLEYWYQNLFALRMGYVYEHPLNGGRSYYSMGTGIRYRQAGIDFSYLYAPTGDQPLANTIRLTAKYFLPARSKPQPVHLPPIVEFPFASVVETQTPEPAALPEIIPDEPVTLTGDIVEIEPRQSVDQFAINYVNSAILNFDLMSSVIKSDFVSVIDSIAHILKRHPDSAIEIHGHTDTTGTEALNIMLAESRARAVWLEVVKQGVNPTRVSLSSFGFNEPRKPNNTREGRALNRRVEFSLIPDTMIVNDAMETDIVTPMNYGNEGKLISDRNLRFEFLNWITLNQAEAEIKQIIQLLNENTDTNIAIGTRISYNRGSARFMRELEKARSEKIKSTLILAGADMNRIQLLSEGSQEWDEFIAPHINLRANEQSVVVGFSK